MRVELVKPSDESTSEPLDFYYTGSGGLEEGEWRTGDWNTSMN